MKFFTLLELDNCLINFVSIFKPKNKIWILYKYHILMQTKQKPTILRPVRIKTEIFNHLKALYFNYFGIDQSAQMLWVDLSWVLQPSQHC